MARIALVENANTQNISLFNEGDYQLNLPDGTSVSPVQAGWVGANYRLCALTIDAPVPSYIREVSISSNAGLGYTNTNILTISGGTVEGNVGQVQVFGVGANGRVTSLGIANSGYYITEPPTHNNPPTGGTGTGLLVDLVMSSYSAQSTTHIYDANTNQVTETIVYEIPVIDNTTSLERQRQADLDGDPGNVSLKDKLRTATRAQIDTWLLNNVTNLAEARNVLGAIVKFLANKHAGDA